jgi:hypothetical protein
LLGLLSSAATVALALRRSIPPRALLARLTLVATTRFSRALFELADLSLHVSPRLLFLFFPCAVMAAIRAALPALGIGVLAGSTEDRFWQRHR